jgi:predicted dienelactone hydrolase
MKYLAIFVFFLLFSINNSYSQSGDYPFIGERTIRFVDSSRNRPLVTEIWYPTTDSIKAGDQSYSPFKRNYTVRNGKLPSGRFPLIMISHGTGGSRFSLEWLAQSLVKHGFVVAAVDHWGNTYNNKIPLQFFEIWQRPQDISFVITQLLSNRDLNKVINSNEIGAAGFSAGGYTVIALAGAVADFKTALTYYRTAGKKEVNFPEYPNLGKMLYDSTLIADSRHIPNLKDSRIKAFFAICPGTGPAFPRKEQFEKITRPVFIIGSKSDSMAPAIQNARHYHSFIKGSGYYEFSGKTGHYVMLAEAGDEIKKSDPLYFTDAPGVNRHEVHVKVDSLANDFFEKYLK